MELSELREKIDQTDTALLELYLKRTGLTEEVAAYKKEHGMPVFDNRREREHLCALAEQAGEENENDIRTLFSLIFELSRARQTSLIGKPGALSGEVLSAMEKTAGREFPPTAAVACQGTEGAYSFLACEKLFKNPKIVSCSGFENVFTAVESGLCRYGVLPIENSTAGSVNAVYDLMIRHRFRIVRSTRIKVDHSLLALPGATLSGIREILSQEQALMQCESFLKTLGDVRLTRCENTAVAAKTVAESGRLDLAALSSRSCAELYGLSSLAEGVQDAKNNHTRFLCIAKETEIYPGADRTSVMMVLPHKPGALYRVLSRFSALGINLLKLESRPIPDRDFEFMFYFDLETSVYSTAFARLLGELSDMCEAFSYLGSYSEVV